MRIAIGCFFVHCAGHCYDFVIYGSRCFFQMVKREFLGKACAGMNQFFVSSLAFVSWDDTFASTWYGVALCSVLHSRTFDCAIRRFTAYVRGTYGTNEAFQRPNVEQYEYTSSKINSKKPTSDTVYSLVYAFN